MARPVSNPEIRPRIAYEDGHVVVAVKPRGRVTLPGRGHTRDSLLNGLVARYGDRLLELGERRDWGLLHRLDRATSGLVAVALDASTYDALRRAFARRRVVKTYLAVARSRPPRAAGAITARLREDRRADRKVAVVDPGGESARTDYRLLGVGRDGRALLLCRIVTGRLHQIRAHLAWIGCPLAGDAVYADPGAPDGRAAAARRADRAILLHAWRLVLPHPATDTPLEVEAAPPAPWQDWARDAEVPLARILARARVDAPGRAPRDAAARAGSPTRRRPRRGSRSRPAGGPPRAGGSRPR